MKKSLALVLLPLLSTTSFVLATNDEMGAPSDPNQNATVHILIKPKENVDPREDSTSTGEGDGGGARVIAEPASAEDLKENPLYTPELVTNLLPFLSPQDQGALAVSSDFHRDVVRNQARGTHRHITEEMSQLTPVDQAFIRAIFGRKLECQVHPHFDIVNFIDYFKGIYYRPSYAHLSLEEFTLRARALGTHTHLLFRTGTNPNKKTNILSQILRLTAEEITARTTALATHASLLFPTGMDPDTHENIVSQALNLTSEELTARATALATHASLFLPTGMDPSTHGDIVYYALQLTPEEIATYAEAFRTSPHFREQKDPYVLSVIINNIMMLGLDSPLMQRGLDATLRESLSGTTLDEMYLSLTFLYHPNSLYDRVKAAYEERFRNENPEIREALIELINPELGADHPLSKELLRLSSQMDNSQNTPAG